MAQYPIDLTTDAEIDTALERAQSAPEPLRIIEATYHPELDLYVLTITGGRRLVLPREQLQFVADATPEQAANLRLNRGGCTFGGPSWTRDFRCRGCLKGGPGRAHGWNR